MLFGSWLSLGRTLALGALFYFALLILLRVFGKRSMGKWNAFDWIVTVAMGSTLATCLLNKNVSLAEGVLAFVVLLALQFVVTWSSVRSHKIARFVKTRPRLLLRDGVMLHDAMRDERVTESEIFAALRAHGIANVNEAASVVLETNGNFSVLKSSATPSDSTLRDVRGFEESDRAAG